MIKNNSFVLSLIILILLELINPHQLSASFQEEDLVSGKGTSSFSYHPLGKSSKIRNRKESLRPSFKTENSLILQTVSQDNTTGSPPLSLKICDVDELSSVPDEVLISSLDYYDLVGEMTKVKEFANLQSQKEVASAFYLSAFIAERELEEAEIKEREALFKQAVDGYTNAYNKAQAEDNYEIAERADEALKRVLSNFREDQKDTDLFKETTFRWFSAKKQNTVIDNATLFFEKSYTFEEKTGILRAVGRIPLRDQDYILEKVLLYTSGIDDAEGRAAIIRAITSIPLKKIESTLDKAAHFLNDVHDGKGKADIIRAMGKIFPHYDLIAPCLPILFSDVQDGRGKAAIITALLNIPSQNFEEYMQKLLPLLEDVRDGKGRAAVIKALANVPYKDLEEVLEYADSLLQTTHRGQGKAAFIRGVYKGLNSVLSEDDTSEDTAP